MAQGTWLLKRWFGKDYQANVYTMAGFGTINDNSGINPRNRQFGVMADWETGQSSSVTNPVFSIKGRWVVNRCTPRVGWALYEGDTGALHTWR